MKYGNEFKLMVIDPEGFCGMGNNQATLIDTINEYNKLYRHITHRRDIDGMFGFEMASEGRITILNSAEKTSTIYMPKELTPIMEEYAGIAYEFLEGFDQISIEYDIHKDNGEYQSKTKERTGEEARELLIEHVKSMSKEQQKRLELTI